MSFYIPPQRRSFGLVNDHLVITQILVAVLGVQVDGSLVYVVDLQAEAPGGGVLLLNPG